MARKVRHSALESRSARLKLKVRRKPYPGPSLGRGISLLYRRNRGNGSWVIKVADGTGNYWTKSFASADDYDNSDGKRVLEFYGAQDAGKRLARGGDGAADSSPITVDAALTDYEADCEARGTDTYNARRPRVHLPATLLTKPVQLLESKELRRWRDSLRGTIADPTINRLCNVLCAALVQAARHDKRISNHEAWNDGLEALPDAQRARPNAVISDDKVSAFATAAYALDPALGLLTDVLAVTGARPSQAIRLKGTLKNSHHLSQFVRV